MTRVLQLAEIVQQDGNDIMISCLLTRNIHHLSTNQLVLLSIQIYKILFLIFVPFSLLFIYTNQLLFSILVRYTVILLSSNNGNLLSVFTFLVVSQVNIFILSSFSLLQTLLIFVVVAIGSDTFFFLLSKDDYISYPPVNTFGCYFFLSVIRCHVVQPKKKKKLTNIF